MSKEENSNEENSNEEKYIYNTIDTEGLSKLQSLLLWSYTDTKAIQFFNDLQLEEKLKEYIQQFRT